MKSTVNDRRLFADIFHDVDLAAVGPMDCIDVLTQQPECRPEALAVRNSDSRFKPPIGLGELILREQPGGSVIASYLVGSGKRFLSGSDNERTGLDAGVHVAAGIGFEFVITPTVPAEVKGPLR